MVEERRDEKNSPPKLPGTATSLFRAASSQFRAASSQFGAATSLFRAGKSRFWERVLAYIHQKGR
jgi:hypothetical protein